MSLSSELKRARRRVADEVARVGDQVAPIAGAVVGAFVPPLGSLTAKVLSGSSLTGGASGVDPRALQAAQAALAAFAQAQASPAVSPPGPAPLPAEVKPAPVGFVARFLRVLKEIFG